MSVTPRRWRSRPSSSMIELDPGVVGPVSRRPDDGVDVELAAVGETHRPPRGADRPRLERDAEPALAARAGSSRSACRASRAATQRASRRSCRAGRTGQPPEQVAPEQALGQRRLARADREVHACASPRAPWRSGSRCCRRRPRARCPSGTSLGRAVAGAVRLEDARVQLVGQRRHARDVERPGGDDDLVGRDAPAVVELEDEAAARRPSATARGCELDGQLERLARTARGRRSPRRGRDSRRDRRGTARREARHSGAA